MVITQQQELVRSKRRIIVNRERVARKTTLAVDTALPPCDGMKNKNRSFLDNAFAGEQNPASI
jgi:hypothetical protein